MFWEKKDTNCVVKSIEINLVCLKNPTMLPTPLENLVGFYAFGEGRYNLDEEVDFCAANRGMVPDSFLEHCLPLDSSLIPIMWFRISSEMILSQKIKVGKSGIFKLR